MRTKVVSLSILAAAAVLTGCKSSKVDSAYVPNETNILGIVHHQPANYGAVSPTTFAVSTDELWARQNFTGNRTTLLWGLITITDY